MNDRRTTWLWPALATVVGVVLLIGCLPIPAFNRHAGDGPRPEKLIGKKPSSDKPLAVGRSTVGDVARVVGFGGYRAVDPAYYVKPYRVVSWDLIICGTATTVTEPRWLVVHFGPGETIQDFEVYSTLPTEFKQRLAPPPPVDPLPPAEERTVREDLVMRRRAETRPSTAPPIHP